MTAPVFREASDRNKDPILETLLALLPPAGQALEIASGTGQHVEWFARHMPDWCWQPSDVDVSALSVIDTRVGQSALPNLSSALKLSADSEPWLPQSNHTQQYDLIYCCNLLHAAPWEVCAGLKRGCASHLRAQGMLVLYGPFFESGVQPSPSNVAFDQSLRLADSRRGVRLLQDVEAEANAAGLHLTSRFSLPSNNLLLAWKRADPDAS